MLDYYLAPILHPLRESVCGSAPPPDPARTSWLAVVGYLTAGIWALCLVFGSYRIIRYPLCFVLSGMLFCEVLVCCQRGGERRETHEATVTLRDLRATRQVGEPSRRRRIRDEAHL